MTDTQPIDPTTDRWHHEVPSPVGPLLIVAGTEAIVGLYHGEHSPAPDRASLGRRLEEDALRARGAPPTPEARAPGPPSRGVELLLQADRELGEYFAGSRHTFHLPIELQGTAFQQQVWAALSAIPYGQTRSYRDIATRLGNPRMGRAIGAAVRSNPVSVIVPGHRVVGSTGAVVGYAAGTETKTALLELELAHRAPSGPVSVPGAHR
ncbi:methylated-DNA--[protein]-cysteine S-methyltransferase [Arthrobacter antioxidans]|uniref:methylated-DNA--[protein]-cysteine S-methyltransferase n=1 Tax=Arthrobacter antioxidans TaxID=2895818 RepID=UPI001FFF4CEC|nr:methylated-DNA--[protein]-cysteine S-methyltransferase [Arthrobacter antioxidans]